MPVPYHRPSITNAETEAVQKVLESGWLTTGKVTAEFEGEIAARVGSRYAVAVNSATAALHIALASLDLGPGDEVIVPTHTFAATSEVVIYTGATPVLVDVERDNLNMDPAGVEAALTPRTKAMMPVHFTGQAADMDALIAIAGDIPIVEDAAHALPTTYKGQMVGSIGLATAFSFYANKTITTGEGGMLTTDDPNIEDRARRLSLHGLSRAAWSRFESGSTWEYDIVEAGFKYNLTDVASAMGLAQLQRLDELATRRREIALTYNEAFSGLAEIDPLVVPRHDDSAWHLYIIRLRLEHLTIDRNTFIARLADRGIGTSVHYKPLHLHPYYTTRFGFDRSDFPVSSDQFDRIISLPIFPGMTHGDVTEVIEGVADIVRSSRR
ncbi:MAG: DegT/DnrJ/EryC1/StrS family aminotransferase [Acidimicrobiia bacterium]|nr:DegT/DnrJ/EryC1/StrS family aminotransferase [Acidimicrobiia bacterium]MBT8248620.1 DegT/DnrJ/EryC1/StrS family aminotransferase [Acidimicrobiia bacterium]NNL26793.1 DegT/DnrJ/EryC1/StrS family aminotransferase [Acidimicrobiia bacterium]